MCYGTVPVRTKPQKHRYCSTLFCVMDTVTKIRQQPYLLYFVHFNFDRALLYVLYSTATVLGTFVYMRRASVFTSVSKREEVSVLSCLPYSVTGT